MIFGMYLVTAAVLHVCMRAAIYCQRPWCEQASASSFAYAYRVWGASFSICNSTITLVLRAHEAASACCPSNLTEMWLEEFGPGCWSASKSSQ